MISGAFNVLAITGSLQMVDGRSLTVFLRCSNGASGSLEALFERRPGRALSAARASVLQVVAQSIIDEPIDYPFFVVSRAAEFLSPPVALSVPALLSEEAELGESVGGRWGRNLKRSRELCRSSPC